MTLTKDVVCGMQVNSGDNQVEYLGVLYSFCSEQCKERFQANPHLYVGLPGQKAPKQHGVSLIKRRRLRLAKPLATDESMSVRDTLQSMMGVQGVLAEGDCVVITYDMLQATAEQIEEKLAEIGIQLGKGWAERLRRAFVHYEEETEAGNLEVRDCKHHHGHY